MNSKPSLSDFYLERVGFEEKVNMRCNLVNGKNLIGRNYKTEVNIFVDSVYCSRKHCLIKVSGDSVIIQDLNSSNSTTINKVKIKDKTGIVHENDIIGIVGGERDSSTFTGKFDLFAYRLCKYNSKNLPTIEIDDDVLIEIEDDTEEIVLSAGDDSTCDVTVSKKIPDKNISTPDAEIPFEGFEGFEANAHPTSHTVTDILSSKNYDVNSKRNGSRRTGSENDVDSSNIISFTSNPYSLNNNQEKRRRMKKSIKKSYCFISKNAKTVEGPNADKLKFKPKRIIRTRESIRQLRERKAKMTDQGLKRKFDHVNDLIEDLAEDTYNSVSNRRPTRIIQQKSQR